MNYTPGNWRVERREGMARAQWGDCVTSDHYGTPTVADGRDSICDCKGPHGEANARLIAAAPEMVGALETMAEKLTALEGAYRIKWGDNSYTTEAHTAGAKARALLARIKGEA